VSPGDEGEKMEKKETKAPEDLGKLLTTLFVIQNNIIDLGEKIDTLIDLQNVPRGLPYITGEKTIASATARGIYNSDNIENILTTLNRPSKTGVLENLSTTGNIFMAMSDNGVETTATEIKVTAGTTYVWHEDDKIAIRFAHIRTDTDGTKYQLIAN